MFWLALVTVSVLMMTELSKPVWLIFYPLQRIQFPFRFNVILTLAVTALIAMAFSALNKPYFSQLFGIKLTAFLLIAGWVPASVWTVLVMFPLQNTNTENQIIQVEESREAPEYRPKWSASMNAINWETSKDIDHWDTQTENEYNALMQRTGVSDDGISKVRVVQGVGQIDIISREPREIRLHAKAMTGIKVFVSQFYYPNWTARLVEEQTDLNVEPSPPDGLLELSIPEGDHEILLRLNQGKEEITGKVISLISVLCLLFYIAWIGFVKKPDKISHN